MIPYQIHKNILEMGAFSITSWGFMVALGFLTALFFISKEAKRNKLNLNQTYDLALYTLIGGIVGARIGWALTEGIGSSFITILQFWKGGMIWHGGLLGALISAYVYIKLKKLNFWKFADVFAVGLPIGHAVGRIGCYLSGYHIGKITNVPWAIPFNGQLRHPVALYEIIFLIPLFFILWKLRTKKLFNGALFGIYIIGYAIIRFILDFFRTDPTYLGLTVAQYSAIALIIISVGFYFNRKE